MSARKCQMAIGPTRATPCTTVYPLTLQGQGKEVQHSPCNTVSKPPCLAALMQVYHTPKGLDGVREIFIRYFCPFGPIKRSNSTGLHLSSFSLQLCTNISALTDFFTHVTLGGAI